MTTITNPDEAISRVIRGEMATGVLKLCSIEFPFTGSDWRQAANTAFTIAYALGVVVPNRDELAKLIGGIVDMVTAKHKELING